MTTTFEKYFIFIFTTALAVLYFITLSDYGVTFDSALGELHLGDRFLYWFTTFDSRYLDMTYHGSPDYAQHDHPDFFDVSVYSRVLPQHSNGFGPLFCALAKQVFYRWLGWLDPIEGAYAGVGILFLTQIVVLYKFCCRRYGFIVASAAVLCLSVYPSYWSHVHNNTKDIPEAVFFTLTLITMYVGITERSKKYILYAAILWGLALATKANAIFIPLVAAPWFIAALIERNQRKESVTSKGELLLLLIAPGVAFVVQIIAWPYLLDNFPVNFWRYVGFLQERGFVGNSQWHAESLITGLVTMPPMVGLLAAIGFISFVVQCVQKRQKWSDVLLVLFWLVIPVIRVTMPGAVDFDGIRHWIEFVPALCIFAGFGVLSFSRVLLFAVDSLKPTAVIREYIRPASIGLTILCLAPTIIWDYQNHPYQIAYYNQIFGGLQAAQAAGMPDATDYWGSSYRSGMRWLNEHAPKDSFLVVGAAEHIVKYSEKLWLRNDIRYRPFAEFNILRRKVTLNPGSRKLYLMYITRHEHYGPGMNEIIGTGKPVFKITVDGGDILVIEQF